MKIKSTLPLILWVVTSASFAQSNTEIYLFDFKKKDNGYELSNPINISQNPGYDSQPSFLPDGSAVLFSSNQDGQSDVVKYSIATGVKVKLTDTPGSEYSPTVTPDGKYFSTILLEKDGTQLLWKYPLNSEAAQVAVPDLKIGYHCWIDNHKLISFVLTEPEFTMQISNLKAGTNKVVGTKIGRSFHKIPKKKLISFIHKETDSTWFVKSIHPKTLKIKKIIATVPATEDMAWTTDGVILMGKNNQLYKYKPGVDSDWAKVVSLEQFGLDGITRIAMSPNGDKIALVVNE